MRIILIFVLFLPQLSSAGKYSYSCEVKGDFTLTDDGLLEAKNAVYLGSTFNVERKSGIVLGDTIGNSSYPTKQVIDMGSSDQSYKLVWISSEVVGIKGAYNSAYLNIAEYNPSFMKPFTLNLGYRTLSGICK